MTTDAELAYNERFPEPDDDIDARREANDNYLQLVREYEEAAMRMAYKYGQLDQAARMVTGER